jgi:lipopolysaccharide transport system permease protein
MVYMIKTLYKYRVLIHALVMRELVARYRGSVFGFLWSFLNPLLLMLVYSFVFAIISRSDMKAYAVFLFSGLIPWLWFSSALLQGVNSIIDGRGLITKSMYGVDPNPLVFSSGDNNHLPRLDPSSIPGLFR